MSSFVSFIFVIAICALVLIAIPSIAAGIGTLLGWIFQAVVIFIGGLLVFGLLCTLIDVVFGTTLCAPEEKTWAF